MGFWADVKALRKKIQEQVDAGAGSQALIKAIGEPPASSAPTPPAPPAAPAAPPARMTAKELREYIAAGGVVRGRKG
jgi:hypothetical protein